MGRTRMKEYGHDFFLEDWEGVKLISFKDLVNINCNCIEL